MSVGTAVGPSRAWYALAAVLFLAAIGAVICEVVLILNLVSLANGGVEFLAPGKKALKLEKPGRYVIWHKFNTMYEGRMYSSGPALPDGTTIKVFGPGGSELAIHADTSTSMRSGMTESNSICIFEADRPGEYTVDVSELTEPRVMMIQQGVFTKFMSTIAVCVLCSFVAILGFALAPTIVAIVAVLRWRARKRTIEEAGQNPAGG